MTLDDRLDEFAFNGYTKMGLTDKQYARQLDPAKLAILSDLLKIIGEDESTEAEPPATINFSALMHNDLRQELRERVKKYCD